MNTGAWVEPDLDRRDDRRYALSMDPTSSGRKLISSRKLTQLAVLVALVAVGFAGAAHPQPAEAKVRISTSQARQEANQYIYKRAASSGRLYKWGVGECRQLSRVRAGCIIWWTQGVMKWAKTCKQRLDYQVHRDGSLWLTKFYPECRPRRA